MLCLEHPRRPYIVYPYMIWFDCYIYFIIVFLFRIFTVNFMCLSIIIITKVSQLIHFFLYNLHFVEFLTHALVIFLVHMQINWAHFMTLIKDNADNNIHIVYVNKYKIRRELKTKKNSEYFRIKQKLQQKCKKWIKVIICNCKTTFNHWLAT